MDSKKILAGSAAFGAGVMYLLDRQVGRRRRAMIRDKAVHGARVAGDAAGKVSRDTRNRVKGLLADIKRVFSKEEVSDRVLVERVRSNLGYAVSHPGSVHVEADGGRVKLTGTVLSAELDNLLKNVKSVRGVRDVTHELEVHDQPGNVPGLQGMGAENVSSGRFELMQANWSPAARLMTGLTGAALIAYGLAKRRVYGGAAAVAGLPLLARAVTNMPLRRIVGASGRRAVDINKTININVPIKEVFNTLSRVEDFPNFTSHVREVSKLAKNRYRWTVSGPAGIKVHWDSVLHSFVPNRQLAWRSEPGSMVKHEGVVEFRTNPDGSTAVNFRLAYNPVAGGVGHALLKLLGADPKTLLDEDLVRMKTFLETGKQPRDAAARQN